MSITLETPPRPRRTVAAAAGPSGSASSSSSPRPSWTCSTRRSPRPPRPRSGPTSAAPTPARVDHRRATRWRWRSACSPAAGSATSSAARQVLLVGMAGFIVASVLCALAPTSGALIAARVAPGRRRRGDAPAVLRPHPRAVRRRRPAEGVRDLRPGHGPDRGARPGARRRARRPRPLRPRLAHDLPRQRPGRPGRDRRSASAPAAHRAGRAPASASTSPSVGHGRRRAPPRSSTRSIEGRELGWPAWCFALMAAGLALLALFVPPPAPPHRRPRRRWSTVHPAAPRLRQRPRARRCASSARWAG